jgi:uncharacterized membrane protein
MWLLILLAVWTFVSVFVGVLLGQALSRVSAAYPPVGPAD